MSEELKISKKDKMWLYLFEFQMTICFIIFGLLLTVESSIYQILFMLGIGIEAIISYGLIVLYVQKYKLKPFFYKWLPKKIKEVFQ